MLAFARLPPAVPPLAAAAVAFLAAQGFGRFGFGLVLPAMRDGLGLSTGEMGVLAGIGLTAYCFSSAPAGALAVRFGTRWVVVAGLLGTAAGLAVTGLADGFATAALGQVLVGMTAPAAIVPVLAVGGRWAAPSFRGRATGLVVGGGGVGLLLAGLFVPLLLAPADTWAWRRAWWGLAGGVVLAAAVAAALLRDPPVRLRRAGRPGTAAVYRSGAVWRLAGLFGLYGVAYIVYGTFFAAQLERHGLDARTAGWIWGLAGLTATGSGLLGGVLADRLGPRPAMVALFALEGSGLALLAGGDGPGWFALSALLYGVSLWGFPAAFAKACAELVGPERAPAALGLLAATFAVGQAAGPLVAGLLADALGSLGPGLLLGALADGLGALGAWRLRAPPRAGRETLGTPG